MVSAPNSLRPYHKSDESRITNPFSAEISVQQAYKSYGLELFSHVYQEFQDRQLSGATIQETFVRAWTSSGSFDPRRGAPCTWLFVIARNGTIDAILRQSVRDGVRTGLRDLLCEEPAGTNPVDVLLDRIQPDEALARLSTKHRRMVSRPRAA